ncbi:MAG TPA: ABC transporter permease [Candidatus Acidoferrales bacterium]|nr:ABC transporter permease [Candidatus Acidoferrales bacterium]
MRWVRKISLRFHSLLHKDAVERDLDEELRFHIERQSAENIAAGMAPAEARRAAQIEFGGTESFKEDCREARKVNHIQEFSRDIRFGLRMLRKNPGFTAVAVLTLALGIGACTAIFSAVNPILFEPLPYPHADRILMIWDRSDGGARGSVTFGTYRELVKRAANFDSIAVMKSWQPTSSGARTPQRLNGQNVSSTYFRVLGVSPALGRDFQASDDIPNGPKVAILSNGLWKRQFGSDPTVIGRQITLTEDASFLRGNDDTYLVIGVMPAGFEDVLAPTAEIWSPLQYDWAVSTSESREWGHHLHMVGRLRSNSTLNQGRQELDLIANMQVPAYPRPPWASLKLGFIVDSLQDDVTRGVKPALLSILGAVMLVLLIACVNVTNLLLARGSQRRGEFAVRTALGAERPRLIRQLLTESLLLAAFGGVLGIAVAVIAVRALVALAPAGLPRASAIGLDGWVLAFTIGLTALIGVLAGVIPAVHASRNSPHSGLQEGSRRTAGGHQWTRGILVVAEIALALILLVGAGLLLRSLARLFSVAPGFDASDLLTMQVQESGHGYIKDSVRWRFFAEAQDAVHRIPGVTAAAFTSILPLTSDREEYGAQFEKDKPGSGQDVFLYGVTPGYFELMGIPLQRGRFLDAHDTTGSPVAVVINASFAKRMFANGDPIGQRLKLGPQKGWDTIVGVVGDVRQESLAADVPDAVYINTTQWEWGDTVLSLVVRGHADVALLAPAIKQAIWSVDKDQPIVRVSTMSELLAASAAERHFVFVLFEAFGIVALTLAAIGIYGVLSGSVTERLREIGVRMALGATPTRILALILRQGMTLTAIGAVLGLMGAALASQALITLLFGITPLDPVTYFGVIALMLIVSAIACWVPAWRAARVDPAITLRAE